MPKCDCGDNVVPGALFPIAPDGDDSLPYVQACDNCDTFQDDWQAARAVAMVLGRRLCRAYDDPEGVTWRPFVIKSDTIVDAEEWE